MKLFLITALALGTTLPIEANEYQAGYSTSKTCVHTEYREEYIPGTLKNPGYVRSWNETIEVPCHDSPVSRRHAYDQIDTNDCSDGTVMGGILGGGLATSISRGKDRWWAIPAGIFGGSMIGCQIDGG